MGVDGALWVPRGGRVLSSLGISATSLPLQVTDFRFDLDPFSVENQQLTQTLKVKRNIVERNHAQEIQEIFTS